MRAHVFICMLALYLVWHLRRSWAPLCFTDEAPPERRDPVAPAERSPAALAKVARQHGDDGQPLHSLSTLFDELATLTRNTVVFTGGPRIAKLALPTPLQRRAFELIGTPIPRAQAKVDRTTSPTNSEPPAQQGVHSSESRTSV